jgi:hypothetical protein
VTGYGLDNQGLIPGGARDVFLEDFSVIHDIQTRSEAPPVGNGLFPQGVKVTTHLHLVPRLRMVGLYLQSLLCLHGIMLELIKHRDVTFLPPLQR